MFIDSLIEIKKSLFCCSCMSVWYLFLAKKFRSIFLFQSCSADYKSIGGRYLLGDFVSYKHTYIYYMKIHNLHTISNTHGSPASRSMHRHGMANENCRSCTNQKYFQMLLLLLLSEKSSNNDFACLIPWNCSAVQAPLQQI